MKITFKEMALRGKEILDKQGPVTLEEAKAQIERLRENSYLRWMRHVIKLKAEAKAPFRKFEVYTINLRDNDISPYRKHWKALLMRSCVSIEGKELYVHAIEAFALHEDCAHESIGLVVSDKIVP